MQKRSRIPEWRRMLSSRSMRDVYERRNAVQTTALIGHVGIVFLWTLGTSVF